MLEVQLEPNGASIVLSKDGKNFSRPVDSKELMGVLEQFCAFDTGLLPPNTRYYNLKGDKLVTVVEFPYAKRTIFVKHDGSNKIHTLEDIPMPAGLFVFNVQLLKNNHKLNNGMMFGLPRKGLTDPNVKLRRYPTPNLDSSGRICWGGYANKLFSEMKTVSALEGVVRAFFRTNFNDHLWGKRCLHESFPWEDINVMMIEEYFNKIAELGDFKDEWMLPAHYSLKEALAQVGVHI